MGVTIETWRARIGLHSQPNKSQKTTTTQGTATGGGSFPCRPRHILLVIGLLLLLSGNVELNPGPSSRRQQSPQQNNASNRPYTNKDESFTTTEVLDILQNPDFSRVTTQPPVKPMAGQVFLYQFTDVNKRDDWRCDQYHFHHDATREQPKADPKFKKLFFVIKTREGKDKRFKKHAYILLGEDNYLVLFQYIGDERIAEDLPHGNSKNASVPYIRLCPSVIRAIKDVSSNFTATLTSLNRQAATSDVPEVYKPRSRLHVMNTRYRGQKDCTKEGHPHSLDKTGEPTLYSLAVALGKDTEVDKIVPEKGKRKNPKRLKNLQHIGFKPIVRASSDSPDNQDNLGPTEDRHVIPVRKPQTPSNFGLVESNTALSAADVDNKPALQSETGQTVHLHPLMGDGANVLETISRENTDQGASEAVDILKTFLQDQCITSSNSITPTDPSQTVKESSLMCSPSEDGNCQISCQDNNQSNLDIAVQTSGNANLAETTPGPPALGNVSYENTQPASLEQFLQAIVNDGRLVKIIQLLLQMQSTWNVHPQPSYQQYRTDEHRAEASAYGASGNSCIKDSDSQWLVSSLPLTASTLITQVRNLWVSDFDMTTDLLLKTDNVQQNTNSNTFPLLLASLVLGAFKMQTEVVQFMETLKERPGHLKPAGNDIIVEVSNHVRFSIGRYTVAGQDLVKLNKSSWLDDSVIHAYLYLLEERFSKEGTKIFILECFLAEFWEKKNYGEWLYKQVPLVEYSWILMPMCRHSHWILLAANIRNGDVCVINSKPSEDTQRKILQHWREYMACRSQETKENLPAWREIQCPVFPQTDGSSCGVHILMAAEALLSGVCPAVMRNCHVSGYREYVKQQLLDSAEMQTNDNEEINVHSSEDVEIIEIPNDTNASKQDFKGEDIRKRTSTQTSVINLHKKSGICEELVRDVSNMELERSTDTTQERFDKCGGLTDDTDFIVTESIHNSEDTGSMEITATSDIVSSDPHDTTPGLCPEDLRSYCEELFQNQKPSFVALTLVCFMKGRLSLTVLDDQENTSPLKDYINWGCKLCNCEETTNAEIRNAFLGLEKLVLISDTLVILRNTNIQRALSTVIADHLQEYIDIIDLKFIYLHIRVHEQDGGFYLCLKGKLVEYLARRFAKEVLQSNLALVLSHDCFGYFHFILLFLKAVKRQLKSDDIQNILENSDRTFGGTFINWMCFGRNAELLKSLLFFLTDNQKAACLTPCCISGNYSIVQLLCIETDLTDCQKNPKSRLTLPGIAHNMESPLAIIESYDTHALPPLHLASLYGHTGVVSCLLENEFEVNAQLVEWSGTNIPFLQGSTAALVAATKGDIDVVKCLIQHGADLNLHDIMFNAPIHSACRSGNRDLVALIARHCCISEGDAEGNTPLHIACERGESDNVSMLLERGADCTMLNYKSEMPLDIVCKEGFLGVAKVILSQKGYPLPYDGSNTPLHKACVAGFTDIIDLLLQYDADRSVTVDDQHPLLIAAYSNNVGVVRILLNTSAAKVVICELNIVSECLTKGHVEIVKLLLEKGDCVTDTVMDWFLLPAIFSKKREIEIVKLLLEKGASVTDTRFSPLAIAFENGDMELVKLLLEKGVSVTNTDMKGYSPLAIACKEGDTEIVKLLLERGANVTDIDRCGYSPLARACEKGDIEIVNLLLEKGANVTDIDKCGYSPLAIACKKRDIEIIKLLLEKGVNMADIDRCGYSPLARACEKGDIEIVKLLLERGASGTELDRCGYSPLPRACEKGDIEIVKLLLERGASGAELDRCGYLPLARACEKGDIEIVKLLLERGASVTKLDRCGYSPLARACEKGDIEIVKLLLEKGASGTELNRCGYSPLARACEKGDIEIVKLLLEKGASVTKLDRCGYSPLARACEKGDKEIVKLLLERGASVTELDRCGYSPLARACEKGDIEIVRLMLEKEASLTETDMDGYSPQIRACTKGHVAIVKLLLEKGASVTDTDMDGYSPLARACEKGDLEIVKLLLEKGASVTDTDMDGYSPLARACEKGDIEIVKLLLEKGASVTELDRCGYSPLARACEKGDKEIVKLLLEKGASVTKLDRYEYSPLARACEKGDIEIVKLLLERGASVIEHDRWGYSPLARACEKGDIEIVKLLLEKVASGTELDRCGYSPLARACEKGDIEIVRLMLEKEASLTETNMDGYSPLARACTKGHIGIVNLLLEKEASVTDIGRCGFSLLAIACIKGHVEIVKLLLEKGASVTDTDMDGYSPLARACEKGDIEIVKLLLEKGASVTELDRCGYSPLARACEKGDIEIVKLLLEKGASVTDTDMDGYSPLARACEKGDIEIVKLLLEKGASVTYTDMDGYSPLARACEKGDIEIVKLLLKKGAIVTELDRCGYSPLARACEKGDIEIVKLLLEKGASVTDTDMDGYSPLARACEKGDIEIVKLLLEKGASGTDTDMDGYSPLARACEKGDIEIVKLLLEKVASVTDINRCGYLPLARACEKGDIEIVKLLLEKGASVTDIGRYRYSPLVSAFIKGHVEIVKLLLEKGASVSETDIDRFSLLVRACEKGVCMSTVYHFFRLSIKRLQHVTSTIDISSFLKWVLQNKHFIMFRMLLPILPSDVSPEFFLQELCCLDSPQALLLLTKMCNEICFQNTLTAAEDVKNIKCIEILNLLNTEDVNDILLHRVVACGYMDLVKRYFEKFPSSHHADSCVMTASRYGHTAVVEWLLHKCCNDKTYIKHSDRCNVLNIQILFYNTHGTIANRKVRTPLYEACYQGHTDVVRLLLQYEMYRSDQAVSSSFHLVCRRGNIDIIHLLLGFGLSVDQVDQTGSTGLYICSKNARDSAVQLLLEKGANPNHVNNEGKTPLHAAIEHNNFTVMTLLLRNTTSLSNVPISMLNNGYMFKIVSENIHEKSLADVDADGNSLLHHAVRFGFPDSVATLLERGVDGSLTNCKKETAMHIAAELGCQKSVRLLFRYHHTSNVENADKQTPLHCAASEGHLNIVKDLFDCDSNVSLKGCLHYAAKSGHTEIVQHLINKGAVVNETDCQSDTPLHHACESGIIQTVDVLLSSKADVNAQGHKGRTPLHMACTRGYDGIVDCLLNHDADPNLRNKFHNTPLLSAVVEGHLDVIKVMMLKGAKPEISGANGSNYLIACCTRGHLHVARYLIEHGANISSIGCQCLSPLSESFSEIFEDQRETIEDIQNTVRSGIEGMTSLHAAMDGNHFDLAEYLINKGADVLENDQYGKSMLMKICEKGNSQVTKAFLSSGSVFPSMLREHIIKGFTIQKTQASSQCEKKLSDSVTVRETGHVIEVIDEPDTDSVNVPPVKVACDRGHDDVASILIAYSAGWLSDMDDSHLYDGKSPLHLAYDAGFMDVVTCLLSSATDSNAVDSNGHTIFHKACEHGDVKTLQNILKFNVEIKQQLCMKSKDGEMLCHIASRRGHIDILKMLLEGGMDLSHLTDEGDNVLHLACSYDKHRVCTFLLDTSPNLALIKNHNGFTPLDIAMRRGNHKIVRIFFAHAKLTQYGRMQNTIWMYFCESVDNINRLNVLVRCSYVMEMTDDHGNTPFHIAAEKGSTRAIDYLLKHDRKDCVKLTNSDGDTPLHLASYQGHSAVVRILSPNFEKDVANNLGDTPLHVSCINAQRGSVLTLLSADSNVNAENNHCDTPLHMVLFSCWTTPDVKPSDTIRIIQHLLAYAADPFCQNISGNTPLHVACSLGKIEIVASLLTYCKDLNIMNRCGKTPLHVACEYDHSAIVDLLLEVTWLRTLQNRDRGVNIDNQDIENGATSLHIACHRNSVPSISLLLEHGASTTIKDNNGNVPVFVACEAGCVQVVKQLLPYSSYQDVNRFGETLLLVACRNGHEDMFQIIVDWVYNGADQNIARWFLNVPVPNHKNMTALHISCQMKNLYFVEQLLLRGAAPNTRDVHGQTALHYSCINGCRVIVSVLLKYMADVSVCDDHLRTPLHYACERGPLDIAEMLVMGGGNLYVRDRDGRTPLDMGSTGHIFLLKQSLRYLRKRQSTSSEDSPCSAKRIRHDSTKRGCTFEDAQTCPRPRSVPQLRRSQSMGETRCVSSDGQRLQKLYDGGM